MSATVLGKSSMWVPGIEKLRTARDRINQTDGNDLSVDCEAN